MYPKRGERGTFLNGEHISSQGRVQWHSGHATNVNKSQALVSGSHRNESFSDCQEQTWEQIQWRKLPLPN
eukprot:9458760-Ditylum_brightwellii.AAC.1